MHAPMHDILCVQLYVTYTKVAAEESQLLPQPWPAWTAIKDYIFIPPEALIFFCRTKSKRNRSEVGPPSDVRTVRAVSIFYGIGQRYGSKWGCSWTRILSRFSNVKERLDVKSLFFFLDCHLKKNPFSAATSLSILSKPNETPPRSSHFHYF